jgi:hypothetical protein
MKNLKIILTIWLLLFTYQLIACTTYIISGKFTPDGKPILFKHRDTDQVKNSLVLFTDGKYKYMGVVNGTEKGWDKSVWGGYNETGFAIINSAAYNNNIGDTTSLRGMDGVLMKRALMVCSTLQDFEKFLDTLKKPYGVNSNYGVIDAYGGAAYYETGNYKYIKVDANDPAIAPDGIIIRTNHSMSSDLSKGFGFNRYETARLLLSQAVKSKNLTPQYLMKTIPRSLYHARIGRDLSHNMPSKRSIPKYEFFVDYIPRLSTTSSFMIVGAKDAGHVEEAMMWTILGFPLTSPALPAWLSLGEIPKALAMNEDYESPICTASLLFKEDCFPIKTDNGTNYINLSAVINKERTGYLQMLMPLEKTIFDKTNLIIKEIEKGTKSKEDLRLLNSWIDEILSKKYKELFNYQLFKN